MSRVRGNGGRAVVSGLLSLSMMLGMVACGGGNGDELTADVTMDGTLRYDPRELEMNLNEETTFTFLNKDNKVHNITVPALSHDIEQNAIEIDVQPGQRGTLRLPSVAQAPRDGFFLFYCKYHQTEGMSGRLKISS
ncbi:MAG TPA: cupredoxin domain-containing protein [Acidimicrobiales bacterium]|nr:cupredoxin domain-containing protein [Acidimicrobiales bacterium]